MGSGAKHVVPHPHTHTLAHTHRTAKWRACVSETEDGAHLIIIEQKLSAGKLTHIRIYIHTYIHMYMVYKVSYLYRLYTPMYILYTTMYMNR